MCKSVCVNMHAGALAGSRRILDLLELELVLGVWMWVLGAELGFSGRTTSSVEH